MAAIVTTTSAEPISSRALVSLMDNADSTDFAQIARSVTVMGGWMIGWTGLLLLAMFL